MPIPLMAAAIGMSALSIGSGLAQNAAIGRTASANAEATEKMLAQQYAVQTNQLQDKATDVNNQLGMELTNLAYQALSATGTTTAVQAETGAYGATAQRLQQNVEMKKALQTDQLVQSAESKLIDIQNEMRNAKYNYESGQMQNAISFNNTMSQQQSGISLLAGGISSGVSFAAAGNSLGWFSK